MKIQMITMENYTICNEIEHCDISSFSNPISFNCYDINVIDFNSKKFWNSGFNIQKSCEQDLNNIYKMIKKSSSTIIVLFPQNIYSGVGTCAKNKIDSIKTVIGLAVGINEYDVFYDNSEVNIENENCKATFAFENTPFDKIMASESKQNVAIRSDNIIITTVDLMKNGGIPLNNFINKYIKNGEKEPIPDWLNDIEFYNDSCIKEKIQQSEEVIKKEQEKIESNNNILKKNNKYKSMLYSTGKELELIILDILKSVYDIEIEDLDDEKKEDFNFEYSNTTYIGEIKGINKAVQFENVAQLLKHIAIYKDRLPKEEVNKSIKGLLFINHERKIKPSDRHTVDNNHAKFAKVNGILIIDTITLLNIVDDFFNKKITKSEFRKMLLNNDGLLNYEKKC